MCGMWYVVYGIIRFGAAIVEFSSLSGDSVFWTSAAAHFISQLHKNIWTSYRIHLLLFGYFWCWNAPTEATAGTKNVSCESIATTWWSRAGIPYYSMYSLFECTIPYFPCNSCLPKTTNFWIVVIKQSLLLS